MADSYSLREVAELLGLSKRALQRRIEEGAFPGRFTVAGRNGLETRVPSSEVDREADASRRRGASAWRREESTPNAREKSSDRPGSTIMPARELESLVPYRAPEIVDSAAVISSSGGSSVSQSDLESMRDAMLAIVREDREMFLSVVRDALVARDREIVALKHDLGAMHRTIEGVRTGLESIEKRLIDRRGGEQTIDAQVWADVLAEGPPESTVDVDALLREIAELEQLLGPNDNR
jgi:hypothetical protein